MMKIIRKQVNGVVGKTILGLFGLTLAFVFGVGDVIQNLFFKSYVVKVGDETVDEATFQAIYKIYEKQFSKLDIDDDQKQSKILSSSVNAAYMEAIMNMLSKKFNISVTDKIIKYSIANDPRFLDDNNVFSVLIFRKYLESENIEERELLFLYDNFLKTNLMRLTPNAVAYVPDLIAKKFMEYELENREIETFAINLNNFNISSTPTNEELQKLYDEHIAEFELPEFREVEFIYFSENDAYVTISEEEVKSEFQKRVLNGEIEFGTKYETVAKDLRSEIEADKSYEYLNNSIEQMQKMSKEGVSLTEIANKFKFVKYFTGFVSQNNLNKEMKEAINLDFKDALIEIAFESKKDSISDCVDCDNGKLAIMHVKNIEPKRVADFEEVKDKLKQIYIHQEQLKLAQKAANDIISQLNESKISFQKAPENFKNSKLEKILLTRNSVNRLPKILNKEIFNEVYKSKEGAIISKINGNQIVITKLLNVIKPHEDSVEENLLDYKENLQKNIADDLFALIINHIKNNNKLEMKESNIKTVSSK